VVYADPRLAELGVRALLPKGLDAAVLGCEAAPEADYHTFRISQGVPEGGRDFAFGEAFPHEALLDQLNGVDFTKGCYVGQEVVSRMEHRGTARRRIVPVEGGAALPVSGTSVEADGLPIGTLGSVSGISGLALIRLDRAEEALARGKTLTAGGIKITLRRPSFARFAVPVAEVPA
jgi:folate-binding protein YgfZ